MIVLEHLTKNYKGFVSAKERILSVLTFGIYGGSLSYKALENLSFTVEKGEVFGIIGRNGAGKSTLLKILSGVSDYDSGKLKVAGNVRSILELGVGFNPELTGEQNVYYNALAIGYSVSEIESALSEIFQFAGLDEYQNQPLKNYSSGMIMRLGFALATAHRPDILLVDEALSVGDASFQQICIKRIQSFIAKGTSVLVVSHDLHLMSTICQRILVLDRGKKIFLGNPTEAIREYMSLLAGSNAEDKANSIGELKYEIHLGSERQKDQAHFFIGEKAILLVNIQLPFSIENLTVGFHIEDHRGVRVFGTNSYLHGKKKNIEKLKTNTCKFQFPIHFREGKYSLSIAIHEGENHTEKCFLWKEGILDFEVDRIHIPKFEGLAYLPVDVDWV